MVSNKKVKEMFIGFLFLITGGLSAFLTKVLVDEPLINSGGMYGASGINQKMLITFLVFFVVIGAICGTVFFLMNRRFGKSHSKNTGSLLNHKQVKKEQYHTGTNFLIPQNSKEFNEPQHLLLSQHIKLRQENFFQHALVISATGTGKSASILIPQIQNVDGDVSLVVTDPKAELFRKTYHHLREKGFKPMLLKLDNPEVSLKYNLLGNCRNINDVRKLAESILGDDEWGRLSQTLLSAFLFRQYHLGGTISDVVKDLAEAPMDVYELQLEYFTDVDAHSEMAYKQFAKTAGSENTVSSIFVTIQSKMKVFEYDNIIEISKGGNFKIDSLRKEKIALFISYPEEESTIYAPFLASFYYQMFNILKGDKSVDESQSDVSGLPVYFLLDEFANIGKIPTMDNLISTIRSKKMGVEIFLQNIEQLQSLYGQEVAETIVQNTGTRMTMYGNSNKSSKYFSDLSGKREEETLSYSSSDGGGISYSSSVQEKQVISVDEVRRMKEWEIVIIASNLRPIKDDKNYYFRNKIDFWVHKNIKADAKTKIKLAKFLNKVLGKKKRG
ncbi:type IV secretory system conjugative DNA transfer family protein [Rossellomorea marisflavi]|uniref:type IV secretory system conjugative DNA transfer family protein n=1 Tax=Rossellomorea marisflavi TaxID=189381 RepID=UPI001EE1731E|nr:type IV secretory system conjugative DNA transfer family protein [Rossellomorea marisflavi]UKS67696.1 type IV secretory system conjugative DNA transfer family protein [Rossellomorea marisflavi]